MNENPNLDLLLSTEKPQSSSNIPQNPSQNQNIPICSNLSQLQPISPTTNDIQPKLQISQSQLTKPSNYSKTPIQLTKEEEIYYNNLFQLADKDKRGILIGKEGANFLKKSSLPKETLKKIWLISAQTNTHFLEKNEFFIALRLIALAQNNFPFSLNNIITNNPIPPFPLFNLNSNHTSTNPEEIFKIEEKERKKYTLIFNKHKEYEDKISFKKAYLMWKSINISDDIIKKILTIVKPIQEKNYFNLYEFQICVHFIYKSRNYEIPSTLPKCLETYLHSNSIKQNNINEERVEMQRLLENIETEMKRYHELNYQNDNLRTQINEIKNQIKVYREQIMNCVFTIASTNEEILKASEELFEVKNELKDIIKESKYKEEMYNENMKYVQENKSDIEVKSVKSEKDNNNNNKEEEEINIEQFSNENKQQQIYIQNQIALAQLNYDDFMNTPIENETPTKNNVINNNQLQNNEFIFDFEHNTNTNTNNMQNFKLEFPPINDKEMDFFDEDNNENDNKIISNTKDKFNNNEEINSGQNTNVNTKANFNFEFENDKHNNNIESNDDNNIKQTTPHNNNFNFDDFNAGNNAFLDFVEKKGDENLRNININNRDNVFDDWDF